jgi:peptidoglycan/xylan/chitin deacetylase (PgdA/CDA1 family)
LPSLSRILQELKLPATFFVCPGLIDTGKWLWNHESRQRLKSLGEAQLQTLASQLGAPHSNPNAIVEWMKQLPHSRRQQAEATLIGHTPDYLPNPSERKQFDLMTWAEIAQLDPSLITIGSHSTHHPILTQLEGHDLQIEIDESRRQLENRLRRPIPLFCYPNGCYNATVVQRVRAVFDAAVTTEARRLAADEDLCRLPRIAAADTLSDMTWRLYRPGS